MTDALREKVARIFDPEAFRIWESRCGTAYDRPRVDRALTKADRILALPEIAGALAGEESAYKRGWDDRETDFLVGVARIQPNGVQENEPWYGDRDPQEVDQAYGEYDGSSCELCGRERVIVGGATGKRICEKCGTYQSAQPNGDALRVAREALERIEACSYADSEEETIARQALAALSATSGEPPDRLAVAMDHEDIAARLHPDLFSSDERTAHRAASPYAVSIKRNEAVEEVGRVLAAASALAALKGG